MFKICFSGLCKNEMSNGECGKRPGDICPDIIKDDDDLTRAEADLLDEAMDAYYNEWEDQNDYR